MIRKFVEFIRGIFEDMANGYSYDRYGNRILDEDDN